MRVNVTVQIVAVVAELAGAELEEGALLRALASGLVRGGTSTILSVGKTHAAPM